MNQQRWGVRKLLAVGIGASLALISAAQLGLGFYYLTQALRAGGQHAFRDTAAFIVNKILVQDAPLEAALTRAHREIAPLLDAPVLVIAGPDGAVRAVAGSCTRTGSRLGRGVVAAASGPLLPVFPIRTSSPCSEAPDLLSAAAFPGEGGTLLALFARSSSLTYMRSTEGVLAFLTYYAPSLLFVILSAWVFFVLLRRRLVWHTRSLVQRARRFAAGDHSVRFHSSEYPEYAQLAAAFNQMASEQSQSLSAIEQDDRQRQRLMADIMHDLQAPATAIEGGVELLDEKRKDEYLTIIEAGAAAQMGLAENLLQLARIDAGAAPLAPEMVDVAQLCVRVAIELLPAAEQKQIRLLQPSGIDNALIEGDALLLRRAISNLIANGIRYTQPGGRVEINVREHPEHVELTVADSGSGIPAADIPHIFQEYYRSSASAAHQPSGTGLGLAIVDRILRLHGASIEVQSALGSGTTFRVRLQRRIPSSAVAQPAAEEPHEVEPPPARALRLPVVSGMAFGFNVIIGVIFLAACSTRAGILITAWELAALAAAAAAVKKRVIGERGCELLALLCMACTVIVAELETSPVVSIAASAALSTTFVYVLAAARGSTGIYAAAAALLLLLTPFQDGPRWDRLLGTVGGISLALGAVLAERVRPLAFRPAALALLFSITAAVGQAAAFFWYSTKAVRSGAERQMEQIVELLSATVPGTVSEPLIEEQLAEYYAINPSYDYFYAEEKVGITAASRVRKESVVESLAGRLDSSAPELFWRSPVPLLSPTEPGTMLLRRIADGGRAVYAGVHAVSNAYGTIMARLVQSASMQLVLEAALIAWVTLVGISAVLGRLTQARFAALRAGLARYRRRDYSQAIGLATDDELGELVTVLDELAQRLPQLSNELLERNRSRRSFLEACAREVRMLAESIAVEARRCRDLGAAAAQEILRPAIAHQRRALESLFMLSRIELGTLALELEQVDILELLEEEVALQSRRASGRGQTVLLAADDVDASVYADQAQVADGFRYFLGAVIDRAANGAEISVTLAERPQLLEIQIGARPPCRLPADALPARVFVRLFAGMGARIDLAADGNVLLSIALPRRRSTIAAEPE